MVRFVEKSRAKMLSSPCLFCNRKKLNSRCFNRIAGGDYIFILVVDHFNFESFVFRSLFHENSSPLISNASFILHRRIIVPIQSSNCIFHRCNINVTYAFCFGIENSVNIRQHSYCRLLPDKLFSTVTAMLTITAE